MILISLNSKHIIHFPSNLFSIFDNNELSLYVILFFENV